MEPASTSNSHPAHPHSIPDTRKLVHRHLRDINDVITDEDIKNVKISKDLPPFLLVTTGAEATIRFNSEENSHSSNQLGSTWNIIEKE